MKKLMLIMMIAWMLIGAGIVKAENVGKWEGFRGIFWATNINDVNDMTLVHTSDDITSYLRVTDKLSIGKAKLSYLRYNFYKDNFASVVIQVKGFSGFQNLKAAVSAYYGEGIQDNEYIEEWVWHHGDVFMVLKYNEFSEETTLFMYYMPIWNEKAQDDKDAAEDAGDDF